MTSAIYAHLSNSCIFIYFYLFKKDIWLLTVAQNILLDIKRIETESNHKLIALNIRSPYPIKNKIWGGGNPGFLFLQGRVENQQWELVVSQQQKEVM